MRRSSIEGFGVNIKIFALSSYWRYTFDKHWQNVVFVLYRVIIWGSYTIFTAQICIDLTTVSNADEMYMNLCQTIIVLVMYWKTVWLHINMAKFDRLREELNVNFHIKEIGQHFEDRKLLRSASRHVTFITKLFYVMAILTIITWNVIPLIDQDEQGNFPFRTWVPLCLRGPPYYYIIYVCHTFFSGFIVTNVLGNDLIYCSMLIQVSAHYSILEKNVRHALRGDWMIARKYHAEMKRVVKHHQMIIWSMKELEAIFNLLILLQTVAGTLLIGIIGFNIIVNVDSITSKLLTQISYVACALVDLFFYCVYGSLVASKSKRVAEAIYEEPWHQLPANMVKDAAFIMLRAQNPPIVTAGKITYVHLPTYLTIIRVAYNCLAILNNVANR